MTKPLLIILLAEGKSELVATFKAVPEEKLHWKPMNAGRAPLDLFSEAANSLSMAEKFVSSRGEIKPSFEIFQEMQKESATWDREQALTAMETNFAAMMAALESVTDEELAAPVDMPGAEGDANIFGVWAMLPYRTFISRFAQINYIQTLYGDTDSHH